METKRWNVKDNLSDHIQAIEEAAALLKQGETVALPIETVYGLGADATSEAAVAKIFQAKGRPQDNPLIAHVARKSQLLQLVEGLPLFAEKLIDAFSPGPITFILPRSEEHTSELQSRGHLVCRLLLEKKKNKEKSD